SGGLTKRCEPASRLVLPVRTARRVPRSRPPPVPSTHARTLRTSFVPLRVPLPTPPESSRPAVPDLESDCARAACPAVSRFLATAVRDPSFESAAASALVAELLDFSAACRLDYATALDAESFPAGTQWCLQRPVYGLRQAPREWHDTVRTTLAALGFSPATADPSLFLRIDTTLPPFYVLVFVDDLVFATADTEALTLVLQCFGFQFSLPQPTPLSTNHSLSAPPSDESVEPSGPDPELVGCLITSGMGLVLGGRGPVVLTGHADASWVDDLVTQQSSQGYTFSLGSGSFSWRSTRSSSVLSSNCEAEIYAGAMAA
ncbi:unnamed protein product, partial [Closterium sp. NIES-53]